MDELEEQSRRRPWAEPVASRGVVVIAASAGGLHALRQVLSALPPDFPAAVAIVQHRGLDAADLLPKLLDSCTALRVRHAADGDLLEAGTVYVCPPGFHMTAERCVRLVEGPKLDYVRPSADLMFRSVARAYGDRAIGVVLSGTGSDGSVGTIDIAEAGGTVLAQDPDSSTHPGMPAAAVGRGAVDLVLPLDRIGEALRDLVSGGARAADDARSSDLRVVLADDHRIILDGLRALLGGEGDIEVVAEAENGRKAVRLAAELVPDVVVMDIAMPELNGIEATRRIRARSEQVKVVALSARADARSAAQIVEAGATGYLCKSAAFAELALAIRSVVAGRPYLGEPARPRSS